MSTRSKRITKLTDESENSHAESENSSSTSSENIGVNANTNMNDNMNVNTSANANMNDNMNVNTNNDDGASMKEMLAALLAANRMNEKRMTELNEYNDKRMNMMAEQNDKRMGLLTEQIQRLTSRDTSLKSERTDIDNTRMHVNDNNNNNNDYGESVKKDTETHGIPANNHSNNNNSRSESVVKNESRTYSTPLHRQSAPVTRRDRISDEDRVRMRDREKDRNEIIIYDSEDESDSYVIWLENREKYYPYTPTSSRYKVRYSLLSVHGRKMEYIRSLFQMSGDKRLFSSGWVRWYQRILFECGDQTYKHVRQVDPRSLLMPGFYVDERDILIDARSVYDNDLSANSHTLSNIPQALRVDPPVKSVADSKYEGVVDYSIGYAARRRIWLASRAHTSSPVAVKEDKNNSDTQEQPAYVTRDRTLDGMPRLEHAHLTNDNSNSNNDNDNDGYSSSGVHMVQMACRQCGLWFSSNGMYNMCPACIQQHSTATMPVVKIEKVSNTPDSSSLNHTHTAAAYQSVLGEDVLSMFDAATRALMNVTRSKVVLSQRDLAKACEVVVKLLPAFSGNVEEAPKFYYAYCMQVQKYNFHVSDCIGILEARMRNEAAAWFTSIMLEIHGCLELDMMPRLLKLYREQYMNRTHTETFRSDLLKIKLHSGRVSKNDLKVHYEAFTSKSNNLRICDPTVSQLTFRQMFVESLNPQLMLFIGDSSDRCTTVDQVFQLAERAIKSIYPVTVAVTQQPLSINTISDHVSDAPSTTHAATSIDAYAQAHLDPFYTQWLYMNAMSMRGGRGGSRGGYGRGGRGGRPYPTTARYDRGSQTCFHCGKAGHIATMCEINAAGQPQTTAGAEVYARYRKQMGMFVPYGSSVTAVARQDPPNPNLIPRASSSSSSSVAPTSVSYARAAATAAKSNAYKAITVESGSDNDDDADA
jgi:hypothetical protein